MYTSVLKWKVISLVKYLIVATPEELTFITRERLAHVALLRI